MTAEQIRGLRRGLTQSGRREQVRSDGRALLCCLGSDVSYDSHNVDVPSRVGHETFVSDDGKRRAFLYPNATSEGLWGLRTHDAAEGTTVDSGAVHPREQLRKLAIDWTADRSG